MRVAHLVGRVLALGCVLLLGCSLLLAVGWQRGAPAEPGARQIARLVQSVPAGVGDDYAAASPESYRLIAERPLFSSDRRPQIKTPPPPAPPPPPADPKSLQVDIGGIIIAPHLKLAIVTDPKTRQSARVREGMPLSGEQAAWTLTEINPRTILFSAGRDESVRRELGANDAAGRKQVGR